MEKKNKTLSILSVYGYYTAQTNHQLVNHSAAMCYHPPNHRRQASKEMDFTENPSKNGTRTQFRALSHYHQ